MDLLKREMERKKQALQEAKQKLATDSAPRRRFIKTIELRRVLDEQDSLKEFNGTKETKEDVTVDASVATSLEVNHSKMEITGDPNPKRRKTNHDRVNESKERTDESAQQNEQQYSLATTIRELRLLGLPVTLFGETLSDRIQRLTNAQNHRTLVQLQETEADEFRLGQGHSIRNPFLEKDEAISSTNMATEFMSNATCDSDAKLEKDLSKRNNSGPTDGPPDPHKRIYRHFKGLLQQWEADLQARPEDVKRSLAGRNETKKVKQCKDYIRPLFQLCKRRQLEENLLNKLDQMVQFCEEGEFVRAHDAYLDVAIGRAAWPIGVTMVGIHARTGRAKIESSNVAHVMNSELQRKYLTSVKRLLTYEQSKRPDVDPSKKVR